MSASYSPEFATLLKLRAAIRSTHLQEESQVLATLKKRAAIDDSLRQAAVAHAAGLVQAIRADTNPGLMEVFLAEYGLSSSEGIALMCLAEALLRVPDTQTVDALIEDKIAPSDWGTHLGRSASSLVNASTWALMLTGKVLQEGEEPNMATVLRGAVRRLGEPVIRTAARRAMKEMGNQFVLGQSIQEATVRGRTQEAKGYTYSYDMLGEAVLTAHDADAFYAAYSKAIKHLATHCKAQDVYDNPGISIKLSALHPRYEVPQRQRVLSELVPRVLALARAAKAAGMGLNIDAEEASRLELSLDVVEAVLQDQSLAGWDGFGVVVQAYGKRALAVIDWLYALATTLDRRIMVRLVKGAYWDSEIKRAQTEGLSDFPVYTHKSATDVAYLCCARVLLQLTDRIYPQFATHNAHTVAMILTMTQRQGVRNFEFQRLQGMGTSLYNKVLADHGSRCRIYAPVGTHRDLLAYLVRRLLENGANSSFVHQIVNLQVPVAEVVADPFAAPNLGAPNPIVTPPAQLFAPERLNSSGFDCHNEETLARIEAQRNMFGHTSWIANPITALPATNHTQGTIHTITNPANTQDIVGYARFATESNVKLALAGAKVWSQPVAQRAAVLNRAAALYETHYAELFALLAREAGKTLPDAVAELREAVDFLRYYAAQAALLSLPPRGCFVCISPWNFPLAIFTGQIAAALAAGNAVIAKPAETTSLIAARAVALLHQAGVPVSALQLLPGTGAETGAALTSDAQVDGVVFTGSTATAHAIQRTMAAHLAADAPLIAETGGLNAMIVDSTALPEQAVRDILISAFRSAGQRCSALRILYLQEDIADSLLAMLYAAMDELTLGNPWVPETDIGPVINTHAQSNIKAYIAKARGQGRVLKTLQCPQSLDSGHFVAPCVIQVRGIEDLGGEVFGPVLHVATYKAQALDAVIDAINATGYGLTFGMHSRIDDRVHQATQRIVAGNLYINRNQIGAVVGSQPFGGHGLSGTGPKAGGPLYLPRFCRWPQGHADSDSSSGSISNVVVDAVVGKSELIKALQIAQAQQKDKKNVEQAQTMPGPTGESNRWSCIPRGVILCLGPGVQAATEQAKQAQAAGCSAVIATPEATGAAGVVAAQVTPALITQLPYLDAVAFWGAAQEASALRVALAARAGAHIPLCTEADLSQRCLVERHLCIDTTASGGNTSLLAGIAV